VTKPTQRMNPEIKAKWIEALRSGRYTQAEGFLRINDSMCCLGVLCDIIAPEDWDRQGEFRGEDMLPPEELCDTIGLPRPARVAELTNDPEAGTITNDLATMNDGGASFAEIADFIEENL
jgi:hypothetical protein